MFESPIYKVKGKIGRKEQEILIDVTGSAPNFKIPGAQLESTFRRLLKDYKKEKIKNNRESNQLGYSWVNTVKEKIFIKKFDTFVNDCTILANLVNQVSVNLYYTQDRDIERAVKLLKIPLSTRLVGEASFISGFKIKE